MVRHCAAFGLLVAAVGLFGCSKTERPATPPTFPVTGTIHIDGKPTAGVRVFMVDPQTAPAVIDPNLGAPHQAVTNSEGKFQITTYYAGDGAPAGSYVLCFFWQGTPKEVPFGIPDDVPVDRTAQRFNNKYSEPGRSKHKVTVEEGKPVDLGVIELTTK